MAEPKKQTTGPVDPWETSKETWQYVTLPDEDPTGLKFPTITLNKISFSAGQTYHVPPPVAEFVKERIKAFNRSVVRLFQPGVDRKALQEVAVGSAVPMAPSGERPGYVDANQIKTL